MGYFQEVERWLDTVFYRPFAGDGIVRQSGSKWPGKKRPARASRQIVFIS
jgi:hypothetical protein